MAVPSTQGKLLHNQEGFVLVLSLILLLMLTLFGVWALQTSDFENRVAGNTQQGERRFNVAEGAAYSEAANVGFNRRAWYTINNPKITDQLLLPRAAADFDPTGNSSNSAAGVDPADETSWPWGNLLGDTGAPARPAPDSDYRYLVTYLSADTPPVGYDANTFSAYKFRIQGNAARLPMVIETAGRRMGIKFNL